MGWGPGALGFRPSWDLDLLREEGNPPNLLASVSPTALTLASFPTLMSPSWYLSSLLLPAARPTLCCQFPVIPSQGPCARHSPDPEHLSPSLRVGGAVPGRPAWKEGEGSKLPRSWIGQGPAICKQGVLHVSVSLGVLPVCERLTGRRAGAEGTQWAWHRVDAQPPVQALPLAASLPAFCRPACSPLAVFCHGPPPSFLAGLPRRPSTFPISSPAPFPERPIFLG